MRPPRRLLRRSVIGLLLVTAIAAGCTDAPDPASDTVEPVLTEEPTTTALVVQFLEVSGQPYCDVVAQVANDIRVYANPDSNFGASADVRDVYVGAFRAFDALSQVAPPEIGADLDLMRRVLADVVKVGPDADWDVTQISATAAQGADATTVAGSLATIRGYTRRVCKVDVLDSPTPDTAPPGETPEQKVRRVLSETFPVLDDRKLNCVAPRLPLDFDPQLATFDPTLLLAAFAACGIDPEDPSIPTSIKPRPFAGPRPTTPVPSTSTP